MKDIDNKYDYITRNWGDKEVRSEYDLKIKNWLDLFSNEEQKLLLKLLYNYNYYDEKRIKRDLVDLDERLKESLGNDYEKYIFTGIEKEFGFSNSSLVLALFRYEANNNSIEPNIVGLIKEDLIPKNIVVVDDYSGSGETFVTLLSNWINVNPEIANSAICFLVCHITKRAERYILDYAKQVGIQLKIVYIRYSEEAFKNNIIFCGKELDQAKCVFEQLCKTKNVPANYLWGYKEVESLVSFYYSTPNNTLGIFWEGDAPLFYRKTQNNHQLHMMQRTAKSRKKQRSELPRVFGINNDKFIYVLDYILEKNGKISIFDFANHFGFDSLKAVELIDVIEKNNYIKKEKDCILPTAKLKSHIVLNRYKRGKVENKKEIIPIDDYVPPNF